MQLREREGLMLSTALRSPLHFQKSRQGAHSEQLSRQQPFSPSAAWEISYKKSKLRKAPNHMYEKTKAYKSFCCSMNAIADQQKEKMTDELYPGKLVASRSGSRTSLRSSHGRLKCLQTSPSYIGCCRRLWGGVARPGNVTVSGITK